jgi:tetratricopeptide (TPR) repeat protein
MTPGALLLAALCLASAAAPADDLGDSLLIHGFLPAAAGEFRRTAFRLEQDSAPDTTRALVQLKLGYCLAAMDLTGQARDAFRRAADLNPPLALAGQNALAGFHARRRRFDLARLELSELLVFTSDSTARTDLRCSLAWLYLAEGSLTSATQAYRLAGRISQAETLAAHAQPRGTRNPDLAMIMSSVIPGTGEMYAGRPLTGALSLLATAAAAAGTVWAVKSDDWVSASLVVSALFLRFYSGSRANAVEFASARNRDARLRAGRDLLRLAPEPDWFEEVSRLTGFRPGPDTWPGPESSIAR